MAKRPEGNKKTVTRRKATAKPAAQKAAGKAAKAPAASKPRTRKKAAEAPATELAAAPTRNPAQEFAIEAARLLHDDKCTEVVLLDVRGRSQVTDFIVIGTGTSDRQMHSVLMHAKDMGEKLGFPAWRVDTDERGMWLLLDAAGVVIHLFEPNTRAHYDLETLWGDAPRLEWERADQVQRDRARLHS